MPFSRSRSIESITRSTSAWFARKAPVWRSIASTRVVLPWSTWATIATLRRSWRVSMPSVGGVGAGLAGSRGAADTAPPGVSLMGRRSVAHAGEPGNSVAASLAAGGGPAERIRWIPRLPRAARPLHSARARGAPMTVAAVILAASPESALADADGTPAVRRIADVAWAGGATPVVVCSFDPDGEVGRVLANAEVTLVDPRRSGAWTRGPDRQRGRGGDAAGGRDRGGAGVARPARPGSTRRP